MVTRIDQPTIRPRVDVNTSRPAEATPQQDATPVDQTQGPDYFELINLADDLAAIAAQLRRRNEVEKSAPGSSDPFERILDEEGELKVEHLLFIAQSPKLTAYELLLQARGLFPDDSDLILVLREIIKRRKLRNENTDVLEEVMQQVWAESNEKLCKAGMNVGIKAQLFAKKMTVSPSALRDTYRDFLLSGDAEISQYEQWVEHYGNMRRHLVAEFIETALLHDIQSHDPSCSRLEFGALLNHVVNFKKLRSSDKAFLDVFLKKKNQHSNKQKKQKKNNAVSNGESKEESKEEAEALACWFDCLQRPFKIQEEIEQNHLAELMARFNLSKAELQQKLLKAIKLLDGDLFFDAEAKDILIDALLALDIKSTP